MIPTLPTLIISRFYLKNHVCPMIAHPGPSFIKKFHKPPYKRSTVFSSDDEIFQPREVFCKSFSPSNFGHNNHPPPLSHLHFIPVRKRVSRSDSLLCFTPKYFGVFFWYAPPVGSLSSLVVDTAISGFKIEFFNHI
jgi:hypothetical protein